MDSVAVLRDVSETNSSVDRIRVISRPHCFLCGADGHRLYGELVDWLFGVPGSWDMRECSTCDIAWLDPQPVAEDIPKLYCRYYTHTCIPKTRFFALRDAVLRCVLARKGYRVEGQERLLPRVLSYVPSISRSAALEVMDLSASEVGSLLDVGCGNGALLERMRSLGWTVTGVDPDPAAVKYCRSRGLQVFHGMVSDAPAGTLYDAICVNHVIEHVIDPVGLLKDCAQHLRPGVGRLIITTPNIKSLGHRRFKKYWRGLEVPRHLILFSPAALNECITRAGLRLNSIRTETRLARMIYSPSMCAKAGEQRVGDRTNFEVSTKVGSYLFQAFEDAGMWWNKHIGEEIIGVCSSAGRS